VWHLQDVNAGFKPEQIEEMLGERFVIFKQAEKALNQRYAALLKGKPEPSRSRRIAEDP
jgi:hypothetical protein